MRNCWKPLPSACHLNLSLFLQKQLSCNNSANEERVVTTISIIKAPVRYQPERYQLVNVYKYSHSYDNLKKASATKRPCFIVILQIMRVARWIVSPLLQKVLYELGFFEGNVWAGFIVRSGKQSVRWLGQCTKLPWNDFAWVQQKVQPSTATTYLISTNHNLAHQLKFLSY